YFLYLHYQIQDTPLTLQNRPEMMGNMENDEQLMVPAIPAKKPSEKRRSRRAKIGSPVKVRPSDPRDEHFEDFPTSVNASREGIYFLTKNSEYYQGMRLFVTFPFTSAHDPMSCEYVARVVRVENLPNSKKFGVAVELLTTMNVKGGKPGPR